MEFQSNEFDTLDIADLEVEVGANGATEVADAEISWFSWAIMSFKDKA